ncbi:hypothetical protein [uncultured Jatrophihabitans sp.]|uniref:hypothetical protein n=1 Tax=uncultured Jatrophihabitans sp. TaxID=1610747 RepID=UPI0035CB7150
MIAKRGAGATSQAQIEFRDLTRWLLLDQAPLRTSLMSTRQTVYFSNVAAARRGLSVTLRPRQGTAAAFAALTRHPEPMSGFDVKAKARGQEIGAMTAEADARIAWSVRQRAAVSIGSSPFLGGIGIVASIIGTRQQPTGALHAFFSRSSARRPPGSLCIITCVHATVSWPRRHSLRSAL